MNKYLIYKATNKINGKCYIGQTKNFERRQKEHLRKNNCPKFMRAMNKYGKENFEWTFLKENLTLDEANYWEEYYIREFDSINNGYNIKFGGDNHTWTNESKQKIVEILGNKIRINGIEYPSQTQASSSLGHGSSYFSHIVTKTKPNTKNYKIELLDESKEWYEIETRRGTQRTITPIKINGNFFHSMQSASLSLNKSKDYIPKIVRRERKKPHNYKIEILDENNNWIEHK